ncbi:MAG: L,D-transpeptidase family protein [Halioglobus sp.]
MSRLLLLAFVLFQVALPATGMSDQGVETWLKVDTEALTLTVMRGKSSEATFENIAIGSNGVTRDKRQGDERTPLGNFRIADVRDSKRFVTFIAFDYPTPGHVRRACAQGDISIADCERLDAALTAGAPTPQNTALGGYLGIHGTGEGDATIHETFNWTNGCIALTNEQLAQLLPWVSPGMLVSVR